MIPPLASFCVDFTFFFCPPALFSPGNRRLSPRRFIGQLSYILHMCVGVCVCECVRRSFGQGPNVLECPRNERICRWFCWYLLHTSSLICCIWMQSLGDLMSILCNTALFFFSFSFVFHLYLNLEGIIEGKPSFTMMLRAQRSKETNVNKNQTLLKSATFKSRVARNHIFKLVHENDRVEFECLLQSTPGWCSKCKQSDQIQC